jgi:hypothetical protein
MFQWHGERLLPSTFAVQVVAQIVGDEPLPWEDTARAKQLLKTAGQYRTPLLTLLRRDPLERPSSQLFCSTARGLHPLPLGLQHKDQKERRFARRSTAMDLYTLFVSTMSCGCL